MLNGRCFQHTGLVLSVRGAGIRIRFDFMENLVLFSPYHALQSVMTRCNGASTDFSGLNSLLLVRKNQRLPIILKLVQMLFLTQRTILQETRIITAGSLLERVYVFIFDRISQHNVLVNSRGTTFFLISGTNKIGSTNFNRRSRPPAGPFSSAGIPWGSVPRAS